MDAAAQTQARVTRKQEAWYGVGMGGSFGKVASLLPVCCQLLVVAISQLPAVSYQQLATSS